MRNSVLHAFSLVLSYAKMTTALDSSLAAAWLLWTNQNALIRKATNEFASFCIDNRLRQMPAILTSLSKWGKDLLDSFSIKTNKIMHDWSLKYMKQIHSMLPCVCSVKHHGTLQNMVKTSATHSAIASYTTFLFFPHFDVICMWSISDQTHGNMEFVS